MQYKIITGSSGLSEKRTVKELVEEVNKEMQDGWVPQGGVCILKGITIYQAMIKPS